MPAVIQLNGVSQRVIVVPFGSTVTLVNASPGITSQKWEVLDYPLDMDEAGPDFGTNFPAWTPAGDGTYFINQTPAFTSVTFKPDVTGPYEIRLTSVEPSGSVTQTAVVRVAEANTGEHLAAAGETTESGTREGWKKIINGRMKRLGKRMQGYIRVVNASGSSIARGKVVKLVGSIDAHLVSPNINPGGSAAAKSEKIFTVQAASNAAAGAELADYAILDQTLADSGMGWAQKFGLFEGKSDVDYTGFVIGTPVYFDSTGAQVAALPTSGFGVPVGVVVDSGSTGTIAVQLAGPPRKNLNANWSTAMPRFFAVDFTAGNDANAGYSDVSMTAAGTVAKKTWAGLLAILPVIGDGRDAIVAIKNRDAAGTSYGEAFTLDGVRGYASLHIVGTTDFTDSTTDRIMSGFVTAFAGPGGSGEWTAVGTPTVNSITVSAGSLPASPGAVLLRVRFTGNVTGALTNVCRTIQTNTTGAGTITLLRDTVTAPVAGDTFYIERPGVVFSSSVCSGVRCRTMFQLRGLGSAGVFTITDCFGGTNISLVACDAKGDATSFKFLDNVNLTSGYTDLSNLSTEIGMGLRVGVTSWTVTNVRNLTITLTGSLVPATFRQVRESLTNGSVFLSTNAFNSCGIAGSGGLVGFIFGRNNSGFRDTVSGAITISSSNVYLQNTVITGAGAAAAVTIIGDKLSIALNAVSGSSGNTGVGLDTVSATNCSIRTITAPTVTGSAGDMALGPSSVPGSWTDLAITNIPDDAGNNIAGAAGLLVPVGMARAITNLSGASRAPGDIVRGNGTSSQVAAAQGDSSSDATGALLVMLTSTASAAIGFAAPLAAGANINFDGAPTANAIAYLSTGTAGKATTTVPAASGSNQRRRLGFVVSAAGTRARLSGSPEFIPVDANGSA